MIQCRDSSWTVSVLSFLIVIVYRKNHCWSWGRDRSGAILGDDGHADAPRDVASDVNMAS